MALLDGLLTSLAGKIAVGAIAILIIICSGLFIALQWKESTNTKLENSVAELTNRNSILEGQVEGYKKYIDTAILSSQKQQESLAKMDSDNQDTLDKLDKLVEMTNGKEKNIDSPLSSDIIGVLSQHCASVAGRVCNNP